ncbi:MAG TPA: hypothetical protein VE093_30890 [Polyangiaceae bacterium]|nr:hypothetical protein [Polyangiaceae bacterium]
MIRLELTGLHTHLHSTLCGTCPQGPAGCCASPPAVAWADIGRITALGGLEWLLEEMRAGNLRPAPRGLAIRRSEEREDDRGKWPRKCVYHGPTGCTVPSDRRSATCNYYLCDDAFEAGGETAGDPTAARARRAHEALTDLYGRWDLELAARIVARYPDGPPWDKPFFQWLAGECAELEGASRKELRPLRPRRG